MFLTGGACRGYGFIDILNLEKGAFARLGRLPLHDDIPLRTLLRYHFLPLSLPKLPIPDNLRLPQLLITFILAHPLVIAIARSHRTIRLPL